VPILPLLALETERFVFCATLKVGIVPPPSEQLAQALIVGPTLALAMQTQFTFGSVEFLDHVKIDPSRRARG